MSDATPRLCPYCADVHMAVESCPFRAVMEGPRDGYDDLRARVADATERLEAEEGAQVQRRQGQWQPFPNPWVAQRVTEGETWTPYDDQDLIQVLAPQAIAQRGVEPRWLPLGVPRVYEGDQA